ncbi:MAG TPA: helix-turn-helix transcriptional regulator [Methylibium sp.]|uniref:AraC family transcriptional regulator n=1 Tax=Methylibium sp. TaxID=2067992 RepID=UPI002DBDF986|nr:helix-turn-helix transcriptional regulator [Methylibium sp.]HEU4458034.1 helix-turn-helix transcriptional regulator [Methylibium sp.]
MPSPSSVAAASVGPVTPHLFEPTPARPLRAKHTLHEAHTRVVPHRHPWAQLAWSATGVMRITAGRGTYLVPPSRAVWIPPGIEHAVTVVESAEMRTLYLHQPGGRCGPGKPKAKSRSQVDADWQRCRVLEVSELLRALMLALPHAPDGGMPPSEAELQREKLIAPLLADELRRAAPVPLGVALPDDRRLRTLCETVLDDPTRHVTLSDWVRDVGASERTVARLFREQLGTSFGQWRQQVLLARALTLAARKTPMGEIAAELGYASPSAFSAMVRRTFGAPPSSLFGSARGALVGNALGAKAAASGAT